MTLLLARRALHSIGFFSVERSGAVLATVLFGLAFFIGSVDSVARFLA
jgi:hypothetical protein